MNPKTIFFACAVGMCLIAGADLYGQERLARNRPHNDGAYQRQALPESLRTQFRPETRILRMNPQRAVWIDSSSGTLRSSDLSSGIVSEIALPEPGTNLADIDFRDMESPILVLSKNGNVFRRDSAATGWNLIDTAVIASGHRAWIYRDPKTLDSCVVTTSVRCYPLDETSPYTLFMSASPQLFIEKFELRFDEPRVGIVILSNGEVVWGEQTANRYWRWIPTAVQITNAKAIGVSGHDEDYVYIADQLGLARFDWRTPELFRSRIENSPAQIDQMYGSLGTRMFFQSGEGVLEFDARSERFAALPLDASDVSAFSANADANGASVILISKNAQVYASTSFNQGACAVTVYDSRSGRPDDYISIGSSGTGSGGIERIVKLTSESDLNLKRNCIFQIAGTKPGVIETFDWSMTTRLSQLTSGARVKIKIFANNDYAPLLRVLYMNARASSARGKGPVVIAQGGLKNLQTGCQVQTELSTQNPQPQGRQTLVRTTITDTNPGCAGVLRNVSVLMCNAAGGVAISSSFVSLFKVATTCSVDVTPSDSAN